MNSRTLTARKSPLRAIGRSSVMALALAGCATLATAVYAPHAMAQREQGDMQNTKGFVRAYQGVAELVTGDAPDWEAAAQRRDEFVSAVGNEADRLTAGQMLVKMGGELQRPELQGEGLRMMLDSGLTPEADVPQYNYYLASFAYNDGNYSEAINRLETALAAGFTDSDNNPANDPEAILLQSYISLEQPAQALGYAMPLIEQRAAAGNPMPEPFIRLALQTALNSNNDEAANTLSRSLLQSYDSADTWRVALQVADQLNELDEQARLDLLRLMRETDSLEQRVHFTTYIENADPRIMANEVKEVLAEGLAAGHFASDDPYYVEISDIVERRAALDRREIDTTIAEGRQGSGMLALDAGDVLYSMQDYTRAAELYELALEKGDADNDMALTRLGMARAKAGDVDGAIEALEQVTGVREPVAGLWALYTKRQAG